MTVYTHGHLESVLHSHRWRTLETSVAYLLPHLAPEPSVLDVARVELAGIGNVS